MLKLWFLRTRKLRSTNSEVQKWGIRRFQNPDGTLTTAGRRRFKSQQQAEYDVAKKSQTKGYRSSYDRMLDYSEKSQVVKTRSAELNDLAKKAQDLSLELDEFRESDKVYDEALRRSVEAAKKDPGYGKYGERVDDKLIDYYMYDADILTKTTKDLCKNDPDYQKLSKEYNQTIKAYKEKCREITNDIIGDYGDKKITGLGTNMNYSELVYYALSKPNHMWMFTYEEDMGRK